MRTVFTLMVALGALAAGCSRARQYELHGQVLAVDKARKEITIKHGDIRGFMPGMTMAFKVRDGRIIEERVAGDLVTATLVVENANGYLSAIERTGHAELTEPPPPPRADWVESGQPVPDVSLIDDAGTARHLSDWRGRAVAVTFVYTRCPLPDFCPRMDRQFKAVQDGILADSALRERAALLSVTIDPAFDTPQVLAAHARRAGADARVWRFATGDAASVRAFASRFGVSIIAEGQGEPGITHNLRTAVIGPDGTLTTTFSADWTPQDLLQALRQTH